MFSGTVFVSPTRILGSPQHRPNLIIIISVIIVLFCCLPTEARRPYLLPPWAVFFTLRTCFLSPPQKKWIPFKVGFRNDANPHSINHANLRLVGGRTPPHIWCCSWCAAEGRLTCLMLQLIGGWPACSASIMWSCSWWVAEGRPSISCLMLLAVGGWMPSFNIRFRTWRVAEGRPYISYVAVGGRPRAARRENITMYIWSCSWWAAEGRPETRQNILYIWSCSWWVAEGRLYLTKIDWYLHAWLSGCHVAGVRAIIPQVRWARLGGPQL